MPEAYLDAPRPARFSAYGTPAEHLEGERSIELSINLVFVGKVARPRGVEPPTFWFVASPTGESKCFTWCRIRAFPPFLLLPSIVR